MTYRLIAVCFLLLATVTRAGAGQLDRLFLQGTQLHRDTLRLTLRGILPFPNAFASHPRATADGWQVLQKYGIYLWSMHLFVQPDLESAFAHQQALSLLDRCVYLINPNIAVDADLHAKDFDQLLHAPQTTLAIYEGGEGYEDQPTHTMQADRWRYLTAAELQQYMPQAGNRAQFALAAFPPADRYGNAPFFVVPAFTKSKLVGINHADDLDDSKLRPVFNKTRTLMRQGYRVVFNTDIDYAIDALKKQERKGQSQAMNRYRSPHIEGFLRSVYRAGKGFDAMLLSPAGKIDAGIVGYVHNNVYRSDSIFGDDINKVKVVDFALMRYLQAHDINFVNAGMVTSYTGSIKGYHVSEQDFDQLVAELPHTEVSLPSGWQDAITVVKATKKLKRPYLEKLIAAGRIPLPLLLINSTDNPTLHNNTRNTSLARLLTEMTSYTIFTPDHDVHEGNGLLPQDLLRYLLPIHRIDIEQVEKLSIMHVATRSGFPVPLLAD